MALSVIVRGGGDLATGVALRLFHCGLKVVITELSCPLAVRRGVAFSEAIYNGSMDVEGVAGILAEDWNAVDNIQSQGSIPVVVDPSLELFRAQRAQKADYPPVVLIDARMRKSAPEDNLEDAVLVIGLGPGFQAPLNCDAVIETNRGHHLGRIFWQGSAEPDTGVPESVNSKASERVLRAPKAGILTGFFQIGDYLKSGQPVAEVEGEPILSPFEGVLRGLLRSGTRTKMGMKVGDVDPRGDPQYCFRVSEKALAIGGSALEVILSKPELRSFLWD